MVQLRCPYCGKKFSTPATKCPHCGTQINKEKKVTIISLIKSAHRYDNPSIVVKDERYQHLGVVNYKEKIELDLDQESKLRFSTQYLESHGAMCTVKPGDVVYLSRNWTIDGLNPIVIHKDNTLPVFDIANKNKVNPVKLIVLVLILALVCFLGFFKSHQRKATVYQETVSTSYEESQSYEISYPADIPEIQEQAAVVRNAKKNFDIELAKALDKLSAPAYQGIMAQKVFWEANEALDKLEIESRKLEILLRRNDFQEYAEQEREEREALKEKYRMVKRNLQQ